MYDYVASIGFEFLQNPKHEATHATYKAMEEKNQAPENQKMPGDQQYVSLSLMFFYLKF